MSFPPPLPVAGYVNLPFDVNPNILIQQAFADIQALIPSWQPMEGQLDVAVIEECAQMTSYSAAVAAQMAMAIFETYGYLVGIYPIAGSPATAACQFTMTDDAGYTIPADTVIGYPVSGTDLILFSLQSTVTITSGSTTGDGVLVCQTVGTFANDLPAAACQMVSAFAQVESIETTATSAGGVDPDTQTSYLNRLTQELQLLAPRPILPNDFALMAQNVTGVFRALAIDGLNPGRTITGGVTTNSSTTISAATGDFTIADEGRTITGTGIPSGDTIATYVNATEVELATAANASGTGITFTLGDLTDQERCVTVCGVDVNGDALSDEVNEELQSYLEGLREVNFLVSTINPTTTEIAVTVSCDSVPGVSSSAVQTNIESALQTFLNPATWGGGANQLPQWVSTSNVVRFTDIAYVIRQVPGVLYIPSGSLTIGIQGDSLGSSDVTLPGDAPLASCGTLSVTVTEAS